MSLNEQTFLACRQPTMVRSEHGYEQVMSISAVHSKVHP